MRWNAGSCLASCSSYKLCHSQQGSCRDPLPILSRSSCCNVQVTKARQKAGRPIGTNMAKKNKKPRHALQGKSCLVVTCALLCMLSSSRAEDTRPARKYIVVPITTVSPVQFFVRKRSRFVLPSRSSHATMSLSGRMLKVPSLLSDFSVVK